VEEKEKERKWLSIKEKRGFEEIDIKKD